MREPNIHYEKYQLLIIERARSFTDTTGHDFEDLISQGNLIYCQARLYFNPDRTKCKFSVWLYHRLNDGLYSYTKRQRRKNAPVTFAQEIEEYHLVAEATADRSMRLQMRLAELSAEAREVAHIILEGPAEALHLALGTGPRKIKAGIKKRLLDRGVPLPKYYKIMTELHQLAYN